MRKYFRTSLLVIFSGCSLMAQNVLIGEGSLLRGRGLCEPSISINPKDPANLVAGTVLDQVFYSQDSGQTWLGDTLVSSYGVWGDPVLVSDTAGHHYYMHLSDPDGDNWSGEGILDRIIIQKSTDGGATWSNGSYTGMFHPKDQDKHWAVVDPKTNAIYLTWTQFDKYGSEDPADESNILFSRSTDGGITWSEAIRINQVPGNCLDGDSTTEGAVPAIGPDGTIYVTWANQNKLYFDRSSDGGETWLEEDLVIAEQAGGWDIDVDGVQRANGMPITLCNLHEGPYQGHLYVNWVDDREGNYDVWFMRSEDGGDSWTEPQKVNDDEGEADQFFTWMTVDQSSGYLYAVFYDRRGLSGRKTDVYMAISRNGGDSWENLKISESPFKTNPMVFFGDYNNISAVNGVVRPIWTRIDGLVMGVWTHLYQENK